MSSHLLSTVEFAERVGFTSKTVADYCRRGLIPGAKRASGGAPWRIPESSVNRIGEQLDDLEIAPRSTRSASRRRTVAA